MIKLINIKNKPTPVYDIYIGRANKWMGLESSKWGNPFHMKNEGQREEVIKKYKEYILNSPDLLNSLHELDDKILGCYCFPRRCHGNILIELRGLQKEGKI